MGWWLTLITLIFCCAGLRRYPLTFRLEYKNGSWRCSWLPKVFFGLAGPVLLSRRPGQKQAREKTGPSGRRVPIRLLLRFFRHNRHYLRLHHAAWLINPVTAQAECIFSLGLGDIMLSAIRTFRIYRARR